MALIVEDGTGRADAQSLVSVARADEILALRLHTSAWDALVGDTTKEKALAWFSRILSRLSWQGSPLNTDQALAWPRVYVQKREPLISSLSLPTDIAYFPSNEVPDFVEEATAVGAMMLLANDPTATPDSKGIKRMTLDVMSIEFDAVDRDTGVREIPDEVAAIIGFALAKGQLGRTAKPAVRV